ncbi:Membrane protein insertase YidC [Buchnera aphidicola (Eriosoma grossulariae)]|uniref:membrane protein insertase YidC n=1 Tax=Buchnera aphidicola TaxID=9 RepID=UPI003463CB9F
MDLLKRNFFVFSFIFISVLLWQTWGNELKINHQNKNQQNIIFSALKKNNFINKKKYVILENDVVSIIINQNGGNIEKVILLKYKDSLNSIKLFHLLENKKNFIYHAQSGIIKNYQLNHFNHQIYPFYKSNNKLFKLKKTEKELRIPFYWVDKDGIEYIKTFILKNGKYYLKIEDKIKNNKNIPLNISIYRQLKQTSKLPVQEKNKNNNFSLHTYRGSAYSTENEKYKKLEFNKSNNIPLNIQTSNGWIAMLQQYFISAWVPIIPKDNIIYTNFLKDRNLSIIGYKSNAVFIAPFSNYSFKSHLWIGPAIQDEMNKIANHLDLTVDYGIFWWLSQPLFKLLKFFHMFIGNWGGSIIVITILIKLIMYPLTKSQYLSMAKMRKLQPKINQIKEKYHDDPKKMSKEIIFLYKTEKINPLKGFVPLLIQMPIFLALYYMLINAVELRHAPFLFWINDLSGKDPYFILPILMGITMFLIQYISPNTITDKLQKKIMNFMPLIFTIFFLWFPSGLVLYYIISNIITILQQKIISRSLKYINYSK